ncbi:N-acetylmuramoyl-L-alanine amidase, partial [Streptomyces sp. NPDC055721]
MRASLASSIAVTCAAVLALPVSLAAPAAATAPPAVAALPPGPEQLPGSTQSLPLEALDGSVRGFGGGTGADPGERGLARRDVRPFSLVGVVWDDPAAALHGTVQVRTRATGGATWSEWQDVETHNDEHGADPETAEGAARALKGSTAPLWVGDSDGVEVRVRGEEQLPEGLRLELVDPGEDAGGAVLPSSRAAAVPAGPTAAEAAASAVNSQLAPYGAAWIPALSKEETEVSFRHFPKAAKAAQAARPPQAAPAKAAPVAAAAAKPYIGPRPKIITRKGWGADEKLREKGFVYTKSIK